MRTRKRHLASRGGIVIVTLGTCFVVASVLPELLGVGAAGFGRYQKAALIIGITIMLTGVAAYCQQNSSSKPIVVRTAVRFLFLLLGLALSELVARTCYDRLAPGLGKRNVSVLLEEIDPEAGFVWRPHPYLLYSNTPNYVGPNGIRQANAQGYRNSKDFADKPPLGTIRILALGGSTTYGDKLDSPDDAWPTQMESLLDSVLQQAPAGKYRNAEVINGGLSWATSAELLSHYVFRDRYLGAHIVVIHTGGNDTFPLLFDDYTPEYTHFRPGWGASPHHLRRGETALLRYSHLARLFYAAWLSDAPARPYCNLNCKPFDLPEEYYLRNALANAPIGFERNLDLLVRNVLSDKAIPVLFPFVLSSDETFAALSPAAARAAAFTTKGRRAGQMALAKNVTVMRRIAEKYEVSLVELDAERIPPKYFLDHCHLSRDGERIKAQLWQPRRNESLGAPPIEAYCERLLAYQGPLSSCNYRGEVQCLRSTNDHHAKRVRHFSSCRGRNKARSQESFFTS